MRHILNFFRRRYVVMNNGQPLPPLNRRYIVMHILNATR